MPNLVPKAIETFVGGFTFTRSFTHPFVGQRVGPLWVMRDVERIRSAGTAKRQAAIARL